jgi:hypothetical protein
MRIIGLKRDQLPYYNYDQNTHYLTPLAQQAAPPFDLGRWVVTCNDNKVVGVSPRSSHHINPITMLYIYKPHHLVHEHR